MRFRSKKEHRKAARKRPTEIAVQHEQEHGNADSFHSGNSLQISNGSSEVTGKVEPYDHEDASEGERTQDTQECKSSARWSKRKHDYCKGKESRTINSPIDYEAIASHNSQQPLLKLPAEIRLQIWELAFGHRTVHPRAMRGHADWQQQERMHWTKWGVSYDVCRQRHSDQEMYELSLLDQDKNEWHEKMQPKWGAPGYHDCDDPFKPRKYRWFVQPVCKQIWVEAIKVAWSTTTFAFVTSGNFQHFVYFSGARLDLITKLCIVTPGTYHSFGAGIGALSGRAKFDKGWKRAFNSRVLENFTSLVGLHLILRCYWGTSQWDTHIVENLEYPPFECLYLPEIIREFQKLHLRPEHTTVLITNGDKDEPYGFHEFTVPLRRKLAQAIRGFILQDKPDRDWSGPGDRMVIWTDRNTAT